MREWFKNSIINKPDMYKLPEPGPLLHWWIFIIISFFFCRFPSQSIIFLEPRYYSSDRSAQGNGTASPCESVASLRLFESWWKDYHFLFVCVSSVGQSAQVFLPQATALVRFPRCSQCCRRGVGRYNTSAYCPPADLCSHLAWLCLKFTF